ncbi:hypothetical protein C823_007522 [Eubacterium plexicaudatum ASF492]|nr:hypothetical protein C823_007522 [Eubacterium plexicaudatum ASF492]
MGQRICKKDLTSEVYLGHLVQGKSRKINYKVKKTVEKPEAEWDRVENTHEPVISEDDFQIVKELLKTDSRKSPQMGQFGFLPGCCFAGTAGSR